MYAINQNNLDLVKECLKNENINCIDHEGFPLIYNACCGNREKIALYLFKLEELNINVYSPINLSVVYMLIHDSKYNLLKELLHNCKNVDLINIHKKVKITALEKATNVYKKYKKLYEEQVKIANLDILLNSSFKILELITEMKIKNNN
jgi:hypothetical protein